MSINRSEGYEEKNRMSINRSEGYEEKNVTLKFTKKNYSSAVFSRTSLGEKKKTWS